MQNDPGGNETTVDGILRLRSQMIDLDRARNRTGDVWHVWVDGIRPGQLYAYRVDDPYQPKDGHRFHLVSDVIDRVLGLGSSAAYAKRYLRDKLLEYEAYIDKHGEDIPEIWNGSGATPNDCAKADRKRENTGGG